MIGYSREFVIPADSEKVLAFLVEDNQRPAPFYYHGEGSDFRASFLCRRNGNEVGIFRYGYFTPAGKLGPKEYLDDPNGEGYEVIRFEIKQFFDNRSKVKGIYELDDPDIENKFLTCLIRLAANSGADSLAVSAQRELDELIDKTTRESGVHWGWTEWRDGPTAGSKERAFALIPNTPLPTQDGTEPKNNAVELQPEPPSPTNQIKRNRAFEKRKQIGRYLSAQIKQNRIKATTKDCLSELNRLPAYKSKNISIRQMDKILAELLKGEYD